MGLYDVISQTFFIVSKGRSRNKKFLERTNCCYNCIVKIKRKIILGREERVAPRSKDIRRSFLKQCKKIVIA